MNFIEEIVEETKKIRKLKFRFPPENNSDAGLHLGHAKSICLNFGLAEKHNAPCVLRFDDTNPDNESLESARAIIENIHWLGFNPSEIRYASDYFDKLYVYALRLVDTGDAYVCDLSSEEIKDNRGVPTRPGKPSPYRNRTKEENLDLFIKMRKGEHNGVLRAKIDMASPNMHMRDPILYRVKRKSHYKTNDKWVIYPTYDFAHPLSDAFENISNSLCTLEFEVHRPLYEWLVDKLVEGDKPKQMEFARLNMTNTIMSKRKINALIESKFLSSWDDPRLPTISGLKRRGYTPTIIRTFCDKIGVSRRENIVDVKLLEACAREELNETANRVMAVINPLKVTITNYPEGKIEYVDAVNNPGDESKGKRKIPFSRNLYIERDDFLEDAPKKFFRLSPDKEVRFKYAYYITCKNVIKNDSGEIVELECEYDPNTNGGWSDDGRKVKGTIHWVCADACEDIDIRLYEPLYLDEEVTEESEINENSLKVIKGKIEPNMDIKETVQFERIGYFIKDKDDKTFNRTVTLRDSYKK